MTRILPALLLLLLGVTATAEDKPATPAKQYQALVKEFSAAAFALHQAETDDQRKKAAELGAKVSPRVLELAEKNPEDPIALDALIQVVTQENWLEYNTTYPGRGKNNLLRRAIAQLLRDHLRSEKLGTATWRASYGFSKECETFLRTVLKKSPHKEVKGQACLRLARFLAGRRHRLDLLADRPDMAKRYEGFFGKGYLIELRKQDRTKADKEIEALFERAVKEYADVKLPYGATVGKEAKSELYEIRHLGVGKQAPDIEGQDQDGKKFKLSDYRGKVVLLYFWSEY